MFFRLVRVAIEQEIIGAAKLYVVEHPFVVAVKKTQLAAGDFDMSEVFVQRRPGVSHRSPQAAFLLAVAVAENKMSGQAAKEKHRFRVFNVAAMNDGGNAASLQSANTWLTVACDAMGVAETAIFT